MKEYIFAPGWAAQDFIPAASFRTPYRVPFVQESGCVRNEEGETDYISMVTRKKMGPGSFIQAECAYEGSGAPLIVLCDDLKTLENGDIQYGEHIEIVLYKNGCNVWHIVVEDGKQKARALVKCRYPVAEGEKHLLKVEFAEKMLKIHCAGVEMDLPCAPLPESFHAGITACEGPCRFYSMKVG